MVLSVCLSQFYMPQSAGTQAQKVAEFFKHKRVLVTGHTGFQGAWLVAMLLQWGARVSGVSLTPPSEPNLFSVLGLQKRIRHYTADVRAHNEITKIFQFEQPEIVFHLAAQALVRAGYEAPYQTFTTNLLGTLTVLESIRLTSSVEAALIMTTDKVYKNSSQPKAHQEDDCLGGEDPYSASKAAADIVAQAYVHGLSAFPHTHTSKIAIARSGNVIGGGDWGTDRLIPDIIRAIFSGSGYVTLRNPTAIRPWQHVLDSLAGYVLLVWHLCQGTAESAGAFNFGPPATEASWTVEKVTRFAMQMLGAGAYQVVPDPFKPEAPYLRLDTRKAERVLGWQQRLRAPECFDWTFSWYRTFYKNPQAIAAFTEEQLAAFLKLV